MTKAFEQRLGQHLEKYLLFISRIHEKKGVDLLIEAYIELRFRGIRIPDLVIAGPGLETSYGKHMQELAAGTKGVFFPGMLTGDAKWGAFYGCEAFVLPSHQENFGIAIVEAMACSKPVLISDKVNIWSEIQKAGAGIITSDTLEGTLKSLQRWSSISKAEKLEISQRARKSYEERFAIAPSSERLLKTIKQ
jgi:glycosyltransferase involved in cell wall biosynthesis